MGYLSGSQPELALASLLALMNRFPSRQSPSVAESILGHLCLVADDERYPAPLRQCAASLIESWSNYADLAFMDACPDVVRRHH